MRVAAALLAVVLAANPAIARELWSRGAASLEISGEILEQLVLTHGTDADRFLERAAADPEHCLLAATFADCEGFDAIGDWFVPTSLTRIRTRLDFRLDEHWSAVAVYDHELRTGRLNSFGGEVLGDISQDTFLGAEDQIEAGDYASWVHLLYRGYVFFESRHFEAEIGRQRIPWGVGRLWNPIDRFNAIPPLAIQSGQTPGVDSIVVRGLFSGFTFLEGVFAPGHVAADRSYALRLHGVLRDVDYSVIAGRFEEAWTTGFDLAANIGGAAARLEVVYTDPERDIWPIGADHPSELDRFWQLVASIDHLFDIGTGVYVLAEYLYNENALGFGRGRAGPLLPLFESSSDPPPGLPAELLPFLEGPFATVTSTDRFGGSRVVTRSKHLSGFQVGYDITPEMRFDLLSILDWQGLSASFFPALRYTPRDWLEITFGAQLFAGNRRSEYGDREPLGFMLVEAFY